MDPKWMIWEFLGRNLKTTLWFLKSAPSNFSICKFLRQTKMPQFGTRTQMFWSWNSKTVFSCLKCTPSNLSTRRILQKKQLKFEIKDVLFGYFSARIWKILLSYLKSACSSLSTSKIGPKTPGFGIFGLEFENNFVMFVINLVKIVSLQNLVQKIKMLHMVPKMAYLGFFF